MAAKTASLSVNIIADAAKAKAGLKEAEGAFGKFRTSINQADGAMGKFQAGASSALSAVKANALGLSAAAGAAIVAFGVKSVTAFQDVALSAGKFADSTGLNVEQASRFIEVAGDMGIEAGAVEGALNRLNRAAASGAKEFGEIGAAIVRTSSGAVDVQKTFLNVQDALRRIEDPAKKAQAATALLGKGWMSMSELINQGSVQLTNSLNSVAEAKVIDEAELEQARKFRDALDELKDRGEELALSLGESLVPALTDIAGVLVAGVEGLKTIHGALKINESDFTDVFAAAEKLKEEQDFLNNAWKEGYRAQINAASASAQLEIELDNQKDAVAEAKAAWDLYKGNLNIQLERERLVEDIDAFGVKWKDTTAAARRQSSEYRQDLLQIQIQLANFAAQHLTTASETTRNKIRIMIDSGDIARMQQAVQLLQYIRNNTLGYVKTPTYGTFAVTPYGAMPARAGGGIITKPEVSMVGEAGAEAIIPLTNPSRAMELMQASGLDMLAMSGGRGGSTTVINVSVDAGLVSSPDQVGQQIIEAIRRAERRSGQVFAGV